MARTRIQTAMARASSAFAALAAVSLAALVGFLLQSEAPDLVYAPSDDAASRIVTGKNKNAKLSSSNAKIITRPLPGFEDRLRAALRFRTVSTLSNPSSHLERPQEMLALHAHLQSSFPLTWRTLKPMIINEFSLLFEWEGSDARAAPGLLVSHLDVVPAPEDDGDGDGDGEEGGGGASWASAGGGPFDGALTAGEDGGHFVGRGALDVKGGALAILEAVEALISPPSNSSSGPPFSPRRTLFIALGHDEEVGGSLGARAMAREIESRLLLQRRGLSSSPSSPPPSPSSSSKDKRPPPPQLAFALDEGGVVLPAGLPPLLNVPVAAVATAEKGYASLRLSLKGNGGHSAMPPLAAAATAASALARAAAAADSSRPRPRLVRPTTDMLRAVGAASGIRGARLGAAAVAWLAEAGEEKEKEWSPLLVLFSSLARAATSRIALAAAGASPPPVAAQLATTVAITRLETALEESGGGEESEGEKRSAEAAAAMKPKPKAAVADNVIPPFAAMTLNYRPLPGDDAMMVPMEHLRKAAAAAGLVFDDGSDGDDDKEKKAKRRRKNSTPLVSASVSALRIEQASAVTPADSKPMRALRRAIASSGMPREGGMAVVVRVFDFSVFFSFRPRRRRKRREERESPSLYLTRPLLFSPSSKKKKQPVLLVGATDSRAYRTLLSSPSSSPLTTPPSSLSSSGLELLESSRILRFQPFATSMADLGRVHASGERLLRRSYVEGVAFYAAFIREADAEEVDL